MIFRGFGWPWVVTCHGFNTNTSTICFPFQLLRKQQSILSLHYLANTLILLVTFLSIQAGSRKEKHILSPANAARNIQQYPVKERVKIIFGIIPTPMANECKRVTCGQLFVNGLGLSLLIGAKLVQNNDRPIYRYIYISIYIYWRLTRIVSQQESEREGICRLIHVKSLKLSPPQVPLAISSQKVNIWYHADPHNQ